MELKIEGLQSIEETRELYSGDLRCSFQKSGVVLGKLSRLI